MSVCLGRNLESQAPPICSAAKSGSVKNVVRAADHPALGTVAVIATGEDMEGSEYPLWTGGRQLENIPVQGIAAGGAIEVMCRIEGEGTGGTSVDKFGREQGVYPTAAGRRQLED